MSTITLPNIRVSSDLTVSVRLKDNGVAIDWSTLNNVKASIYSDAQRALAGRCDVSVDAEDPTVLVCQYAANKPQYVGVCRIVVSAKYMGETKTYDKPAFNFVRWTADQDGEQITIDDPDVDVEIDVADVSSSLLDEAIRAAFTAAEEAVDAKDQVLETEAEVEAAEALRVSAEESRVEAEEGRAEAEAARVDEEAVRVSAEDARVVAENARAAAEDLREGAEDDRAAAETARETAEAARVAAEALRVTAEGSRETAEAAREAQASADHTVAAGDHTQAAADHTQAAADHTTAASDHTQAGADHTLAAADHVTAGEDHAQAQDDHEVMEGYDTRLGSVESEVSQLEAKVTDLYGAEDLKFDFSSGSVAQYANRWVAYKFVAGKKYRIEVETEDATIDTYFSFRDDSGNVVGNQNQICLGSGARYADYTCTGDATRLYMSYMSAGPAILYDVKVGNLTDESIFQAEDKLVKTEGRVSILENDVKKLDTFLMWTSPASGTYKGVNIPFVHPIGEKILVRIETTSPDGYYVRAFKGGTLCGSVVPSATGNTDKLFVLPWETDELQFRVASCTGEYSYTVMVAGFVSAIAIGAVETANEAKELAESFDARLNSKTKWTSPASGNYQGVNIEREIKTGDQLLIRITTNSVDEYYSRGFLNGTLVGTIIPGAVGSKYFLFTAQGDMDTIQFRIYHCTGVYDYTIEVADFAGYMAGDALNKANEAIADVDNFKREYYLPVPEYATEQKNRILGILRELSTKSCLVVGFNTDQHMSILHNPQNEYYPIARGLNALRSLAETFPFDAIVLGGDETSYASTTKEEVLTDVNDVIRNCDTSFCPVVALAGNHDAGQNYSYVGADGRQEFNTKTKRNVTRKDAISFGVRSTNLFFDDDANKVRFVFLDRWSRNQSEILPILNEALSDNKLKNSEWKVLFFSHDVIKEGLSTNNFSPIETNIPEVWTAIQNFVNDGGNVVACVNGHCHKDVQDVYGGIPFIATTCAGKSVETSFDGIQYTRTNDTPNETAFDVFVFDFTDEKLYCLRYGAGMDRVFNLASGSVGLMLVSVSGTVTGATVGDVVKVSHNNTVYTYTLTSEMGYTFPYICPGLGEWDVVVEHNGSEIPP